MIEKEVDSKIRELIKIYGNSCWMGYSLTRNNPYTFHHIREKCKGGKRGVKNGALLTVYAHRDLNVIERNLKKYYIELNEMFRYLNDSKMPPTAEYYREINRILKKVSTVIELSKCFNAKREIVIVNEDPFDISKPKAKSRIRLNSKLSSRKI